MFKALQPALEAKTDIPPNRKKVESLIFDIIDTLDPSHTNSKRYKEQFASWSDTQFHSYMQGIKERRIKLTLYIPNLKLNLKMSDIFSAAHKLDLTLFESVRLFDSTTRRSYLTPNKYPILLLPVRRLKQFLMDKISVPESDAKIDPFTGQVIKPDKGSAISSVEMQTILSKGLKTSISELIRVRGGDIHAYASMRGQLEENGIAYLNEIDPDSRARSSVIFKTYLLAAHIDNNV